MNSKPNLHRSTRDFLRRNHWIALGSVLAAIALLYLPTLSFAFAYDDFGQIVDNPKIKSWTLAFSYFRSHVWSQRMSLALYYRPLYMLWLRLNNSIFGLRPQWWHLIAVVLHLTVCALVYFVVRDLTKDRLTAIIAALLFGVHPAHVESVAWVSGSTDTLLACCMLGALLCYQKHRESGRNASDPWWAVSLLLALSAVLVKETGLVMPAIIFGYEFLFDREDSAWPPKFRRACRAAIPFVAVSCVFLVMRTAALGSLAPPPTKVGRLQILMGWPEAILFYVGHSLLPFQMSVFYRLLAVPHPDLMNFILPLLLVFGGAIGLFWGSRQSRVLMFLAVWWIVMMVPVLNATLWNNVENIHDRYLYLPSIAVCTAVAIFLKRLWARQYRRTAALILTTITLCNAALVVWNLQYWRNDIALAQHGMDVSPGHPIAPQVMGNALVREGEVSQAIPYFVSALDAMPSNVDTLCNLGYCYSVANALSLAEQCVSSALAADPTEPRAHLVLGLIRLKQGRLDEAEAAIRRAIRLKRVSDGITVFHYDLGNVLYAKGDIPGALSEYRMELRNDPSTDPAFAAAKERIEQIEGGRLIDPR